MAVYSTGASWTLVWVLLGAIVASGTAAAAHPKVFAYRRIPVAFAAGGFGKSPASSSTTSSKKKKKSRQNIQKDDSSSGGTTAATTGLGRETLPPHYLTTPEQRMEYIASRVRKVDLSSLAPTADGGTTEGAICVVDNFLEDPYLSRTFRAEAESLLLQNKMVPSQSTRWDEASQKVICYEKLNVYSTQLEGGPEGYAATPHLVEYIVTLTQHLSQHVANQPWFADEFALSETQQTNKLAVCCGDGSHYDKHIDNMGGSDLRKLTALLYLQPPGKDMSELGGCFCAHDVDGEKESERCFEPICDRMVIFWSDALVHHVSPSFAPAGQQDHRWALTTWFISDDTRGGHIRTTSEDVEGRHFGTG